MNKRFDFTGICILIICALYTCISHIFIHFGLVSLFERHASFLPFYRISKRSYTLYLVHQAGHSVPFEQRRDVFGGRVQPGSKALCTVSARVTRATRNEREYVSFAAHRQKRHLPLSCTAPHKVNQA